MELRLKKHLNLIYLYQFLLFLVLFSLFFPIRHVFFDLQAYKLGQYSDFTAFSIYLSDIFIVLLAIFTIYWYPEAFLRSLGRLKFLLLWLYLVLAINLNPKDLTQAYWGLKWLEFVVAYATIATLARDLRLKDWFLKLFVGFSTIQALLALWQFLIQGFVGLNKLGEQLLSPRQVGFAKIIVDHITYVRGYGTFPHPNPLSAFLVAAILILVHLLSLSESRKARVLYTGLLFINITGLVATFSRAAILAVILGGGIYLGGMLMKRQLTAHIRSTAIIFAACLLAQVVIFKPFLLSRATVSDSASLERIFYAKVGLKIIKAHPVFGVGIGESVLHMQQFSSIQLDPWQIQPAHNYFLLAATELGIIGTLMLIWIFISHLWQLTKKFKAGFEYPLSTFNFLLFTILCSFLLLMQFDHYFYTLQQTQLLLWIILGLIAAETKTPSAMQGSQNLKS